MSKEIQYADLIGVPFKNLGRDVKSGLDCYGLVAEIYRRCGKEIGEYYSDCSDKARINAILNHFNTCYWPHTVFISVQFLLYKNGKVRHLFAPSKDLYPSLCFKRLLVIDRDPNTEIAVITTLQFPIPSSFRCTLISVSLLWITAVL